MKPSDFQIHPWDSVTQDSGSETVALNIMVILYRTGNAFRDLTWDEYKEERQKDGNFSEFEKSKFNNVIPYLKNADTARLFSKDWASIKPSN